MARETLPRQGSLEQGGVKVATQSLPSEVSKAGRSGMAKQKIRA